MNLPRVRLNWTFFLRVVIILGYWPVALLSPYYKSTPYADFALLAMGIVVIAFYAPSAYLSLAQKKLDNVGQLILGIVVSWAGLVLAIGWLLLYYMLQQPHWMRVSPIGGFPIYLMVLGGILHVTAPNASSGRGSRGIWISVLAIALGLFTAGTLIAVKLLVMDYH